MGASTLRGSEEEDSRWFCVLLLMWNECVLRSLEAIIRGEAEGLSYRLLNAAMVADKHGCHGYPLQSRSFFDTRCHSMASGQMLLPCEFCAGSKSNLKQVRHI